MVEKVEKECAENREVLSASLSFLLSNNCWNCLNVEKGQCGKGSVRNAEKGQECGKGSGANCAKHPKGRAGNWLLTLFSALAPFFAFTLLNLSHQWEQNHIPN